MDDFNCRFDSMHDEILRAHRSARRRAWAVTVLTAIWYLSLSSALVGGIYLAGVRMGEW